MSKKLNRAVESLSLASLQLASAIENLTAIAREEAGRAKNCTGPLSDLKVTAMSISDFAELCKKGAEQSGCIAEEPNKAYMGQTGDVYVGQTSDTCVGQTECSTEAVAQAVAQAVTQAAAQRISIPPIDLMAVSKGEIAKSQATSVETVSEADDTPEAATHTEAAEVAERAMYFQHNGSDSIFMVKKGESLAFLTNDDVSEISKSQYHRLKKQQEADEAAAKLAADEAANAADEATSATDEATSAADEATDDAADEATDDAADEAASAGDEAKNNAMFKLITKTLTQACNDTLITRVDIKKKLAKYDGATSISALTYDQKMDLWESWAKDFAEDDTFPF